MCVYCVADQWVALVIAHRNDKSFSSMQWETRNDRGKRSFEETRGGQAYNRETAIHNYLTSPPLLLTLHLFTDLTAKRNQSLLPFAHKPQKNKTTKERKKNPFTSNSTTRISQSLYLWPFPSSLWIISRETCDRKEKNGIDAGELGSSGRSGHRIRENGEPDRSLLHHLLGALSVTFVFLVPVEACHPSDQAVLGVRRRRRRRRSPRLPRPLHPQRSQDPLPLAEAGLSPLFLSLWFRWLSYFRYYQFILICCCWFCSSDFFLLVL